ncbi:MAG: DMT family transporter [Pseudomonadota bacterium]
MYSRRTAYSCIITAAACWGIIGVFSKHLSSIGFSILQLVSLRAFFSVFAILIFLLVRNKKLPRIKAEDSIYFAGTGIISFVFFNWCYFISVNATSLSVAAILLYTAPAFVTVFSSILFREKMTRRKIAALLLTFIGCALVSLLNNGASRGISITGILAGLGAGFGYALYSIFGRYALMKYDSYTVTFYTFVFASVFLLPTSNLPVTLELLGNTEALYYSAAISLISTVIPFLLYTKGLSMIETGKASIIATLEPVVATMAGILLFSEPVTPYKITGILLVVLAISIMDGKEKKSMDIEL